MKKALSLALLCGAAFLIGNPVKKDEARAATCHIMYTAGMASATGYIGSDGVSYVEWMPIVAPRPQDACTQANVNSFSPCIDWNQGAAMAVTEGRRRLSTGQVVTLTHSAPGSNGYYVFGTSQCTYTGAGNVAPPSPPPPKVVDGGSTTVGDGRISSTTSSSTVTPSGGAIGVGGTGAGDSVGFR